MGMSGGSHTRVHSWAADLAANIKITASRFDAENDDFSSSLSVMIARDGQSTITANIPFSNFKPTGVTAASALDQFTTYADVNTGRPNFITVVETTADNSISGVGAIAITAYTTGQPVFWIPGFNNTGGATLTISGLSAASVLAGGAALTSGMLLSGVPAMVVSDGSGWHCMNPQRAPANFNVVGSYQASSIATADVQDNAFTLAKLNHESTQGAVITMGASGTPQYLTATTSGLPLVTKGASVDAAFQQIGVAGIADNSITLAKWNHETVQGAIVYTDASGTPSYLAPGTSGQVLQSAGASANPSWASVSSTSSRNDIINGGLVVNQENQTAPADDAYTIGDLFLHVGEGTPVMSLETDGPQGTRPWQKMVLDANAQGGLVYFMSNDDVQDYIAAGSLSFGVQLRTVTGALIDNARIGILKWNSTADTITSDVVATWASDGTDPTLATNWSYENTPADLALTNAWQRFTVENVTVDSDTTNIAIFIWTDDGTITASDVIGFSEWQCNPGATVNDFSQPGPGEISRRVKYYVEELCANNATYETYAAGCANSTTYALFNIPYSVKHKVPTLSSSAFGTFAVLDASGHTPVATSIDLHRARLNGMRVDAQTTGLVADAGVILERYSTGTTSLFIDARF